MRPKVLFLINSLHGGGAERVMSILLAHSGPERRRFDVKLALLDRTATSYDLPPDLPIIQLDAGGSLVRSLRQLSRLVRAEQPDVIVSFLARANLANVAVSRLRGRPCVISERVNASQHFSRGLKDLVARELVRLAYPMADKVLTVSDGVAADLDVNFGVPRGKIEVIHNPVDIDRCRELASAAPQPPVDRPFFLGMGRLVKGKNFALLVRAFVAAGVPGDLLILGEGPEEGALRDLARRLGAADRVRFLGFCENPFALIARARAFVLPSNVEGFPNSLAEAMALGVPVISTNCRSGPAEILAEARTERLRFDGVLQAAHGLLTPPDDVEAMAQALRLMQDEDLRRSYAERAAARVQAFGARAVAERYWRAIEAVLPPA